MATWDELLAEGESLKIMEERIEAEHGNVRWQWGDLALRVAPMGSGPGGAGNGATDLLEKFADELDVSFESLRQYRNVADKWPIGMRVPMQPWAVHQQIAGREDREELIANPVDVRTGEVMERWTFRAMQRYLGLKESPSYGAPPRTPDEKADAVLALLDDPEVVSALEARDDKRGKKPPKTFDDRCKAWVALASKVFRDGARLTEEAETTETTAGPHSGLALLIYGRMVERRIDAELRSILDEADL